MWRCRHKLFITVLALGVDCVSSVAQITNGLIVYYPFDGDYTDHSGNGLDATGNATFVADRLGNPNGAVYFDGVDDSVRWPLDASLKPPLPVSFALWVKIESLDPLKNKYFNTDNQPNLYHGFWLTFAASGILQISYGAGTGVSPPDRRSKEASVPLTIGLWYHIVAVVRGPTDMDVYVNCQNAGGAYTGSGGPLSYSSLYHGVSGYRTAKPPVPIQYNWGWIDEFYFWNRALTPTEVLDFCNCNVEVRDTSTCVGSPITLSPGYGPGFTSYRWEPSIGLSDSTIAFPVANPNSITVYTITASTPACTVRDSFMVTVNPLPDVDAGEDVEVCAGDSAILTAANANSYQWQPVGLIGGSISVVPQLTTIYLVAGADTNGCVNSDDVTVTVNPLPIIQSSTDVTICSGQATLLSASGAMAYTWMPGALVGDVISVSPPASNIYTVTGVDAKGCADTLSVKVTVDPGCEVTSVVIPNAFSPNRDGLNDVFTPMLAGFTLKRLTIYNRWGQEIFSSTDVSAGWDGRYRNEDMPIGSYAYLIRGTYPNGVEKQYSGNVTLIR